MESLTARLSKSRRAFGRHATVLVGSFRRASGQFASDTHQATTRFNGFVVKEAGGLWRYANRRADPGQLRKSAGRFPERAERELLLQVARVLDAAQGRVGQRLRQLSPPEADPPTHQGPPLAGYERLTARAIVARIATLSPDQCRKVHQFEGTHKGRATVLRALQQRIAG